MHSNFLVYLKQILILLQKENNIIKISGMIFVYIFVKGAGLNNFPISILKFVTDQYVTDIRCATYFIQPPKCAKNE